jgi:hypothetical protein
MLVTNPTSSARDRSWFVAMNSSPFKELYPSAGFFAKQPVNGFLVALADSACCFGGDSMRQVIGCEGV